MSGYNMENDKLKILIDKLLLELKNKYSYYNLVEFYNLNSRFEYILDLAINQNPDIRSFLLSIKKRPSYDFDISEAIQSCNHIIELLDIEETMKLNIEKGDIFQGARDKLDEAAVCFRREDYSGTINNLNTCLELLLKEKFCIPTTIKKINTAKIINIAIKYDVGPTKYFDETRKFVTEIDNKIKHMGYSPSKTESIHAIKIMEELSKNLENYDITLTEEIINKIYSGV